MPIYEYECDCCEMRFEKFLPMHRRDEPLTQPCPNGCEKSNVTLQWSTSSIIADSFKLGRVKPSDEFRDKIRRVKKAHPGSTIRDN